MITMVRLMKRPTKRMVSVADAGTTEALRKVNSKTASLMVSVERFSKMAQCSRECGKKDGDMALVEKNLVTDSKEQAHGPTIIISNNEQLMLSFPFQWM